MNASTQRAMIYTRISRDDSGEGRSNERQRVDCEKLAELRGWEVVGLEQDISISAYSGKKRPGWDRVVDAMRAGTVDVVIAWHIDRITRTVRELTDIVALSRGTGVGIATVTGDLDLTNDAGKMVATILSAVAEQEVERKSARQRRANQQRAVEGQPWPSGWRPFGYNRDGTVVETEAELIRDAAAKVLGGQSLNSIARHWKSLGVSTPRSSKGADGWTHNGVRSILLNPRNAAIATYRGEVVGRGAWEPIFSDETHIELVATLTNPSRLSRPVSRGRTASNLLSGIARCSTCDAPVTGGTGHRGTLIYQCGRYHVSTSRKEADEIVRSAFALAIATLAPNALMPLPAPSGGEDLIAESARLRRRLESVAESFAAGAIEIEQLETASRSLRAQLASLEERLSERGDEGQSDLIALRASNVRKFLTLGLHEQRAILSNLAVITLHPKGRGRRSVPITHQVTMFLRVPRSRVETDEDSVSEDDWRLIPALNERPTESAPASNSTEPLSKGAEISSKR
jgi:DNA invertase Pin-like site-specific DNA recombinase